MRCPTRSRPLGRPPDAHSPRRSLPLRTKRGQGVRFPKGAPAMSAASARSAADIPFPAPAHLPHTAHPIPLREQAFTLHCQGLRSPAIAAELGVSERTIRAWIAAALADLKDEHQHTRREQLLLAVACQHEITATAWQQFERETATRAALLDVCLAAYLPTRPDLRPDAHHDSTQSPSAPSGEHAASSATTARTSTALRPPHLPASTPAPRYLSLILQANKETNRLLGLYTRAALDLLTPETAPESEIPAETATASAPESEIPAETAATSVTDTPLPPPRRSMVTSRIPAETATASASLPSPARRRAGGAVPHPWMM